MFFAIDGIPLIREPHRINVRKSEHRNQMTAGRKPMVQPGHEYSIVECTWGRNYTYESVLNELKRLCANVGMHMITFQPGRGGRYITVNAFMGNSSYSMTRRMASGRIAMGAMTIEFVQMDSPSMLYPLRIPLPGIIAVLDSFAYRIAPLSGQIFMVDGWIHNLGAGAGQTQIQVSNSDRAIDYLSTPGDFVCVPPNHRLQNQVLDIDADYYGGDQIDIDVDQIPAMGLSAGAWITLWSWVFYPS